MATPPRHQKTNEPPFDTKRAEGGVHWAVYFGIGIIVLLLLVFLFGGFNNDTVITSDDPAVVETQPAATEPAVSPVTTDVDPVEADVQDDPVLDDPAPESTDDDSVIEIEGDAEVEVLDET